jgi:hypothetical protein
VTDDLQARLAAADPLVNGRSEATPAPLRLDAIKERIVRGDPNMTTHTSRRVGRPAAIGLVAALVVTGAAVATSILGPATFQPAGDGVAGQQLTAKGSGCAANAMVTVTLDGQQIGTATADANGLFIVEARVPAGTSLGQHELRSTCDDGAGQAVVQTTTIDIVTAPESLGPKTFLAGYGIAGQELAAKGSGCAANATVTIALDGRQVGTATADRDGFFGISAQVPAGTALGQHELKSTCVDGTGQAVVQTTTISVMKAPTSFPPKAVP